MSEQTKSIESQEDQPTFDFSDVSWRESKRQLRIIAEMQAAGEAGDMDKVDALLEETSAFFAKVVTHVPRSWLVRSAPEALDWTDPASFDYLRSDKVAALRAAMNRAQAATSGN